MLTNLYFVRHAHSTYTPDEFGRPLSEKGKADAEEVTQFLKKENIDIVISSPYKRAIQTVESVAEFWGKEIIIEHEFKERILSKGPVDNFELAIAKVWNDPAYSWVGG